MTISAEVNNEFVSRRRQLLKAGTALGVGSMVGFPALVHAQANQTIKIGIPTILSGRVAQLGISSHNAAQMAFDKFNESGGLGGRKVELIARDSKGKPEEAARLVREMVNSDKCDLILDCTASSGAFAVHEVVRELGTLCLHVNSETSSLSADPKLRIPNAFRVARQGAFDAVSGGSFAATIAKQKNLKTWMTVSPDYAYGRDTVKQFLKYLNHFDGTVKLVGQSWPKLFEPDYTGTITNILQQKPEALFVGMWGGDLASFINQGNLYGLFSKIEVFAINLGDYTTLKGIKNLPAGVYSANRYLANFPDTPSNAAWSAAYAKRFKDLPTNWSWQAASGALFMIEAMHKTQSVDGKKMAQALTGMTIDAPFGVGGKLTLRDSDQTLVNYALGWGPLISKPPYIEKMTPTSWKEIYELEAQWAKEMGYTS
ncbi:MAG: ABC transporter substrate-binding protein [Candidimonas sp.]|nr:MAG: ABC transporter substrate-binding protein [Candidimonas sp.]TAM22191.1 MAG: ABC transporter substrate-binding protein [Candidimonas sp.]